MICPNCGMELDDNELICPVCEYSFEEEGYDEEEYAEAEYAEETYEEAAPEDDSVPEDDEYAAPAEEAVPESVPTKAPEPAPAPQSDFTKGGEKKPSSAPIIIFLIVALAVVGGVLAYVLMSNKDDTTSTSGTSTSSASQTGTLAAGDDEKTPDEATAEESEETKAPEEDKTEAPEETKAPEEDKTEAPTEAVTEAKTEEKTEAPTTTTTEEKTEAPTTTEAQSNIIFETYDGGIEHPRELVFLVRDGNKFKLFYHSSGGALYYYVSTATGNLDNGYWYGSAQSFSCDSQYGFPDFTVYPYMDEMSVRLKPENNMLIISYGYGDGTNFYKSCDGFTAPYLGTIDTKDTSLNVRYMPSTDSGVLGKIAKGTEIQILGTFYDDNNGEWYAIYHNGEVGFVSADYVKLIAYNNE